MSTGVAVSQLTGGIVNNQNISNCAGDAVKKLLFGTLEERVDAKFKAHLDSVGSIKKYQDQLKKILNLGGNGTHRKIVFFVDELDRCKPIFSLQVIESIKHLFNIDNVFFVLAINKNQLKKTIAAAYGIDTEDATIYFQKFIHLETELPSIRTSGNEQRDFLEPNLNKYIQDLAELHQIGQTFTDCHLNYSVLVDLVNRQDLLLSPRSIERAFSLITVGIGSTLPGTALMSKDYLKALCLMAVLKVAKPLLYNAAREGKILRSNNAFSKGLFEFLERYLDSTANSDHTSNYFHCPAVLQTCLILDIYGIQLPLEKEDLRKSTADESGLS